MFWIVHKIYQAKIFLKFRTKKKIFYFHFLSSWISSSVSLITSCVVASKFLESFNQEKKVLNFLEFNGWINAFLNDSLYISQSNSKWYIFQLKTLLLIYIFLNSLLEKKSNFTLKWIFVCYAHSCHQFFIGI